MKCMELPDHSGYCLECGAEREPSTKKQGLFKSKCPSCGDVTWVEKEEEENPWTKPLKGQDLTRFLFKWLAGSLFILAISFILASSKWGDDWEFVEPTQAIFSIVLGGLLFVFPAEAKGKD